jgi:GR25 family glycosyltransferase involved in LPS biosynthesis
MENPFNYFDCIYCVNLPESVERWNLCEELFVSLGIENKVIKMHAKKPNEKIFIRNCVSPEMCWPVGQVGDSLSHLKIYAHAMENNYQKILIFEDDIKIHKTPSETLDKLSTSINELPDNWDMFYLGCLPKEKVVRYSENLVCLGEVWGGSSYALHGKMIHEAFNAIIDDVTYVPFDGGVLTKLSKNKNSFSIYPTLFQERNGSDSLIMLNWYQDHDQDYREAWETCKPDY